ncbi:hypothetical protein ACIRSS_22830 [Amycolatopsis sp. NPDC101161]|uniref:hypothetical protein n=1 Tax=Amycolatopsis sp. NPDC101161 TaxID=3363940 RepID=UPI0038201985
MFDPVRDPRFPGRVNDIAVECGNSLHQPLLDAYTAGGDVPDISRVRRDTTQPSCGFSLFYEQLFALVRQVNTKLPAERKIRVLACDPPIAAEAPQGLDVVRAGALEARRRQRGGLAAGAASTPARRTSWRITTGGWVRGRR